MLVFPSRVRNEQFVPHGQKVVEHFMQKPGGLLEFEKLWRRRFVETMEPKFLPALWSVDHTPQRMANIMGNGHLGNGSSEMMELHGDLEVTNEKSEVKVCNNISDGMAF